MSEFRGVIEHLDGRELLQPGFPFISGKLPTQKSILWCSIVRRRVKVRFLRRRSFHVLDYFRGARCFQVFYLVL